MGAYVVHNQGAIPALTASTTKTLVYINPAVVDIVINEISISFDSPSAATAIEVDLYRTTNATSAAGPSFTPVKTTKPGSGGTAAQSTALINLTVEPTAIEVVRTYFISPASGLMVLQFPLGKEPAALGGGQPIGLRVVTPAGVTPHALAYLDFSE
jgi:hypothetical protein